MTKSMVTNILELLLLSGAIGYTAFDSFLKIRKWIKKRKRGPRSTSSWSWRRTYSEAIFKLLPAEINDITEMWEISWGAMNPKTLNKMLNIVRWKQYCRFHKMHYSVPEMVDDLGELPVGPYYLMIAIVKKAKQVDVLIVADDDDIKHLKLINYIPNTGLKLWAIKNKSFVYPD